MLNQAHLTNADVYYNRERPSILALVHEGPNLILDLGCGAGAVGRKLLELGKASEVVGVELFASAAEEASKYYSKVHSGDIEEMELPYEERFDYAICGDILEHLKDPYSVVRRIRRWLKPGGHLICSVPNVRYWRILVDLAFRGAWDYREAGIMDQTHLRFFTRKSALKMVREAGFEVDATRMLITGRRYKLLNSISLGLFQEFLGPQVVVRSRNTTPSVQEKRAGDSMKSPGFVNV